MLLLMMVAEDNVHNDVNVFKLLIMITMMTMTVMI